MIPFVITSSNDDIYHSMSNEPDLSDMVPVQEEDYDEGTVDIYSDLLGVGASQERGYNDDYYDDGMNEEVMVRSSHSYHNDNNDVVYDEPHIEQPLYHAPGQAKRERDYIITEIVETEMKYLQSLKGNAE